MSLPNNELYEIFTFFNKQDLGKTAQVCKDWNTLANNELLWRNLLIKDFNFTPKKVEDLKNTEEYKNKSYKELYHSLVLPLDVFQTKIYEDFKKNGLTKKMLQDDPSFCSSFHITALYRLITTDRLSADEAMQKLKGLTPGQAEAMSRGLTREEALIPANVVNLHTDMF